MASCITSFSYDELDSVLLLSVVDPRSSANQPSASRILRGRPRTCPGRCARRSQWRLVDQMYQEFLLYFAHCQCKVGRQCLLCRLPVELKLIIKYQKLLRFSYFKIES